MSQRLENRVALITGTGGGQGRAAALRFAQEGAIVIGCDLDAEESARTVELVTAAGGRMTASAPVDLSDPEQASEWVRAAGEQHGRIDVLYNNASSPKFGSVAEMSDEDWHYTLRNELDLIFFVTRAAWPYLVESEHASVINTASLTGMVAVRPVPGSFAHAATKQGVLGMTRELAAEGSAVGIRVNAISPGVIVVPSNKPILDAMPELREQFIAHQLVKRMGEPDDISGPAAFLASDDAKFVSGSNLVVDGGYTVA